jgi:hypothetical protein
VSCLRHRRVRYLKLCDRTGFPPRSSSSQGNSTVFVRPQRSGVLSLASCGFTDVFLAAHRSLGLTTLSRLISSENRSPGNKIMRAMHLCSRQTLSEENVRAVARYRCVQSVRARVWRSQSSVPLCDGRARYTSANIIQLGSDCAIRTNTRPSCYSV